MSEQTQQPVALRHQRELTISRLCEHFALDHIQDADLERLIDRAHSAKSVMELESLFYGLPTIVRETAARPAGALMASVEAQQTIVAIMGGAERKGMWTPARFTRILALMGGVALDFREVRMPPGITEIHIAAVMGGAEIIVPPGMHVSCDGLGIMGGFEHSGSGYAEDPAPDAPMLRVTGLAFMGGVQITVRYPGESPGDAKRRRKLESKARLLDRDRRLRSGES